MAPKTFYLEILFSNRNGYRWMPCHITLPLTGLRRVERFARGIMRAEPDVAAVLIHDTAESYQCRQGPPGLRGAGEPVSVIGNPEDRCGC